MMQVKLRAEPKAIGGHPRSQLWGFEEDTVVEAVGIAPLGAVRVAVFGLPNVGKPCEFRRPFNLYCNLTATANVCSVGKGVRRGGIRALYNGF